MRRSPITLATERRELADRRRADPGRSLTTERREYRRCRSSGRGVIRMAALVAEAAGRRALVRH